MSKSRYILERILAWLGAEWHEDLFRCDHCREWIYSLCNSSLVPSLVSPNPFHLEKLGVSLAIPGIQRLITY